jgi:hypothetical protein
MIPVPFNFAVSMYLIVWLAFVVVGAIAVFAHGITLPQFPL